VVDRTTTAFEAMIAIQRASGATSGDHFAKPGANDRVWNALEKLAVAALTTQGAAVMQVAGLTKLLPTFPTVEEASA